MFTGIIEETGVIRQCRRQGGKYILSVECRIVCETDDSVAVNGICLTVTDTRDGMITFHAVDETAARTTLPSWSAGIPVNLERGMPASGRFDGHMVQGHIDGTATLKAVYRKEDNAEMSFSCRRELTDLMVEKGSVAINGVSLTIKSVSASGFSVALIPYTLENTTLNNVKPGQPVNVEMDIIGKYIRKFLTESKGLEEKIKQWGY